MVPEHAEVHRALRAFSSSGRWSASAACRRRYYRKFQPTAQRGQRHQEVHQVHARERHRHAHQVQHHAGRQRTGKAPNALQTSEPVKQPDLNSAPARVPPEQISGGGRAGPNWCWLHRRMAQCAWPPNQQVHHAIARGRRGDGHHRTFRLAPAIAQRRPRPSPRRASRAGAAETRSVAHRAPAPASVTPHDLPPGRRRQTVHSSQLRGCVGQGWPDEGAEHARASTCRSEMAPLCARRLPPVPGLPRELGTQLRVGGVEARRHRWRSPGFSSPESARRDGWQGTPRCASMATSSPA